MQRETEKESEKGGGLENATQNLAVARAPGTISLNWGRVI